MGNKRFKIGLSFPGDDEYREYIEKIAKLLAVKYEEENILYDKYHEEEFNSFKLNEKLPFLYENKCELICVFLCEEYSKKYWCKLEWEKIRNVLEERHEGVMFFRMDDIDFDNCDIPKIHKGCGCTDCKNEGVWRDHHQLVKLMFKRLDRLAQEEKHQITQQGENKNALLPQTPLAIAGLFSRWFGDPSLFEEGDFFDKIAKEVGLSLSNLKRAFSEGDRQKIFECWYEIARYCFRKNNIIDLENEVKNDTYEFNWNNYPEAVKPAGNCSEKKIIDHAHALKGEDDWFQMTDNNEKPPQDILLWSFLGIWGETGSGNIHNIAINEFKISKKSNLEKAKELNWFNTKKKFNDKELAFALAAFYLDTIFQTKDVEFKQNFKELLLASRKAVPSRYMLMITLLQYSPFVLNKAKEWREELIEKTACSYDEQTKHLYLLCSLTALLLDAGEEIVSAKEDVINWIRNKKMEKLYRFIPDISLQLGFYDYNGFNCECDYGCLSCIAAARILFIEDKKKLEDSLRCKNTKRIKTIKSIEKTSLSAAEIYYKEYFLCLSVIKIKSKEQIDTIRKIALKDIYAKETDVNSAIRCLCKHPVPKSTLPLEESETRKKWLNLLVEKYKDTSCHEDIENYSKLITDDLFPKEKDILKKRYFKSVMGDSHA